VWNLVSHIKKPGQNEVFDNRLLKVFERKREKSDMAGEKFI
jgi:hypothetical protein